MSVQIIQFPTIGNALLYFLITVTGILTIFHFWYQTLRKAKLGNKIPGPKTWPIIGNILEGINKNPTDIMHFAKGLHEKNGKVIRVWVGTRLGVSLIDPRDIELILGSNTHIEKPEEYDLFEPWLGEGLLISNGEKWKSHRKMIVPTFHMSILKTFMPVFNKNADNLIEALKKEKDKVFDVHDYMSSATVDILLETVMGVKKTDEDNTGFQYAKAVMDLCNILHLRHYKFWLRPNFIFKLTKLATDQLNYLNIIHSLSNSVIKRKKENYYERKKRGEISLYETAVNENSDNTPETGTMSFGTALKDDLDDYDVGEKRRLAFLDFMIEASHMDNNNLSNKDIKEETDTIMFEGHDTTAAATSFALCLLAIYQDIQEKVVQELNDIMDSNRQMTFNDVINMKYLERVILETLRLYPPVPLIGRIIREELKLVSGDYVLPKDTSVAIGTFLVHRDPKYYPNPEKFDPDNFLPERCQQRHYYSFIPFSAGPRSCVGRKYAMLKMKVLLAKIIRKFKIIPVCEEKDFQLQGDIILKRADGFRIKLEERV